MVRRLLGILGILLPLGATGWAQTPPGTVIENTALASYGIGGPQLVTSESNPVTIVTVVARTASALDLLQYAPVCPQAVLLHVPVTSYSASGDDRDPFLPLPPPVPAGSSEPLDLTAPLPLVPGSIFHQGEPLFIRLDDLDQNLDPHVVETVRVRVTLPSKNEVELLSLTETGPSSGIFLGYVQSVGDPRGSPYDGRLGVTESTSVEVRYGDPADSGDLSVVGALFDPYGIVFSSATGEPISGVPVTLLDAATGLPATVQADDGIGSFPSTVLSGGTVTDGSGRQHAFPAGSFRFPFVRSGSYRLAVQPTAGYAAPSAVATEVLQGLPGAPFAIGEPGSRGEAFPLNPGPSFRIDVPLDPASDSVSLTKSAGKQLVTRGEFLPYTLQVENQNTSPSGEVTVDDHLPLGFRYQPGSTRIDGEAAADPQVSADGRTLAFSLGSLPPGAAVSIRYVVEVGAAARLGDAINTAQAFAADRPVANAALASVRVVEDLFGSTALIVGQVIAGQTAEGPDDPTAGAPAVMDTVNAAGVAGVRIYLEDGTYAVTDERGRYHFEGLTPGTHVVQIDAASLPVGFAVVPGETARPKVAPDEGGRDEAGGRLSRFVDLQAGSLWRIDFTLRPVPQRIPRGRVGLALSGHGSSPLIDYQVDMQGSTVPVSKLRLTVALPESVTYRAGTSSLEGLPLPDPEQDENVLTYRLGDSPANWQKHLQLSVEITGQKAAPSLVAKALLTFDTPDGKALRTDLLQITTGPGPAAPPAAAPNPESSGSVVAPAAIARTEIETSGAPAAQRAPSQVSPQGTSGSPPAATTSPGGSQPEVPQLDADWLEAAAPGVELLWPCEGFTPAIPSLKVMVKHRPDEQLELWHNGEPVPALSFDGTTVNEAGTVALSRWSGIDLVEGDNRIVVVGRGGPGSDGAEMWRFERVVHYAGPPVFAELLPARSTLVADGRTPPVVAVRLTDRYGKPARLGVIGEFAVQPPYLARQEVEAYKQDPLAGSRRRHPVYTIGADGVGLVELEATSQSGEAILHFYFVTGEQEIRAWLQPEARDWILVGLAEGTVGYNNLSGNMEGLQDAGVEEDYWDDGRLAFYAKGRIKGRWLLTMAFDSERGWDSDGNSLYQVIDPDAYYTLYGDATDQRYDAASARKLYVKLERRQFYALFGDFDTGLTINELARYQRSFNGVKSELRLDHLHLNAFGAETSHGFHRDEIRGDGTSGLYQLSHPSLVINSEKVVIETRDRFRSEVILEQRPLGRHTDYNIDYEAGTLFFKEPVNSQNEQLNPIFIVIDYETRLADDAFQNYGGRGAVILGPQKLELGGTYVHEELPDDQTDLLGLDARLRLGQQLDLRGEAVQTDGDRAGIGQAWQAALSGRTGGLQGRVYAREQEAGFGLGQQNRTETGTRKYGFDGDYQIDPSLQVAALAYRQRNLITAAAREVAESRAQWRSERLTARSGLRYAADEFADGRRQLSSQATAGLGWTTWERRVLLQVDREQSLGHNENVDFPDRSSLGVDYKLLRALSLLGRYEITDGRGHDNEDRDTQSARVGMKAIPWGGGEVTSSLERRFTEGTERTFANLGLRQLWQIDQRWGLDVGIDHSAASASVLGQTWNEAVPPASGSDNDITAGSVGVHFKGNRWRWNTRFEVHRSDAMHKWGLNPNLLVEPNSDLGLAASARAFQSKYATGRKSDAEVRLSLASRPAHSHWVVLDRLSWFSSDSKGPGVDLSSWRIVNNLHANYIAPESFQVSLQLGLKYLRDDIDGGRYSGWTDLLGLETRKNLGRRWDVGLHHSSLHSANSHQIDHSSGASVGCHLMRDVWLSLGYNLWGFEDLDFSAGGFTAQGPYLKFRLKFDQQTMGQLLGRNHDLRN